jgi:hypothetical protein
MAVAADGAPSRAGSSAVEGAGRGSFEPQALSASATIDQDRIGPERQGNMSTVCRESCFAATIFSSPHSRSVALGGDLAASRFEHEPWMHVLDRFVSQLPPHGTGALGAVAPLGGTSPIAGASSAEMPVAGISNGNIPLKTTLPPHSSVA